MSEMTIESRIKANIFSFSGKMGLYVNDFKGKKIEINADDEFETASCIKVPILVELLRLVNDRKINLDDKLNYKKEHFVVGSGVLRALTPGLELSINDIATLMIIVSDNIATNILIEKLGIDNINNTMRDLNLKHTILHNKIDFDNYRKLGTSTPREYASIFERVYKGELWSKEMSEKFISILRQQNYNSMLTKEIAPYYLDSEDTGDEELIYIASKSGSMNACRNDGGIVFTPYGGYAISLFTKEFQDPLFYNEHESYKFGPKVSNLILNHFISKEGRL